MRLPMYEWDGTLIIVALSTWLGILSSVMARLSVNIPLHLFEHALVFRCQNEDVIASRLPWQQLSIKEWAKKGVL